MKRTVTILATGGTISSQGGRGAATPTSKARDLVESIEPLPDDVAVDDVIDVKYVISPALSLRDMWDVVEVARQVARDGRCDGIVVTHGTATVIDTAFLAYLLWDADVGLAFTGAMATGDRVTKDGPKNLRDAILAAAHPGLRAVGPMLVINGLIHSPRFVKKTHKSALDAFDSGSYGTFGYVDDDKVITTGVIGSPPALAVEAPPDDSAVQLVKTVPGMDDVLIEAAIGASSGAVVVECLPGRGGVPPALEGPILGAIEAGTAVILAGEGAGRIQGNYAGPAHAAYYVERGAVPGGDLSPSRCRTLATVLLAADASLEGIREAFTRIAP